jgi:SEC-C motif-containing protein
MTCACGSQLETEKCCEPYVLGTDFAPTAEALMRSRYVSYTMGKVEYISTTHDPDKRDEVDLKAAEQWAEHAEWQGLDIIETEAGGAADDEGVVEFAARFGMQGKDQKHHERSRFKKIEGKWYYIDGDMVKSKPIVREGAKVGRNEPCPCGSGKKYKRCCG